MAEGNPPLGVAFSGGAAAADIVACAALAESLGYHSAWVSEGHGGDQFATLAGCAAATSKIALGTAISSVFIRSAPTIAMAAATVDDLSRGRFILGLGSSHRVQVEPEHGLAFEKPIQRVRETVTIVRRLLAEGTVSHAGETITIENFDLWFKPYRPELPIYLAGLFPKMTTVCGEIADGIILTRSTLDTAPEIRRYLDEGAAQAGRDPASVQVTSLLPTAVADTRAEAIAIMRPALAMYAGFFPRYNKLLANHGFVEEAANVAAAFRRGDMDETCRAVTDAMVEATSVVGTSAECREQIAAYRQSGIDLPIISSPFLRDGSPRKRLETAIRACAGA